jgi:signal transduction histidine kinase
MAVYGLYMAVAWMLDQTWLRSVGRIRLLSADARFVWINLFIGVVLFVAVTLMMILGTTRASGYVLVATLVLGLTPGINGLSWVYDAAFRRLVILHVLFFVGAGLVVGMHLAAARLAIPTGAAWWLALAAAVVLALVLPSRLDALLERFFFPRSGRMRARIVEIATEPLRAANRAAAGAELLGRIVHVLDSEGGIFVAGGAGIEPAVVHGTGKVDVKVLGGSAAEAAGYVASIPLPRGPCAIEDLPLAHQLRLLEAGVVFVCPLTGRKTEATVLLGPRRGWLYDVATVDSLRVFASQAGLALENLALLSARAHAEKLAALGEAAARIAHEIRNPLSAARSLVQLAGEADGVGSLTAPAVTELDRIGQLVTDLLAFARRDETIARARVDLGAVCRTALNQVAVLAHDAEVDVRSSIDAAAVDGDANRLVQVVANLCRNAIEALAAGGPPRRVELRCTAAAGTACIEVRDSGPGIPAADLTRIFEPFATTKSAGTGLGLPIARRIVEAHGGALAAESTPGAETIFRVVLPLADGAEPRGKTKTIP